MDLSDEELGYVYDVLSDEIYYGDDEIVYGDGSKAVALRSAVTKVVEECKRRGFAWAR